MAGQAPPLTRLSFMSDLRPLTSAPFPCRLIVDPPRSGAWNMGVDEALLTAVAGGDAATLRLYQWEEPTLSLGYFQRYADRESHAASRNAAVVRRQSGGGALMHDRELTYSLVLPTAHPLARDTQRLYYAMHHAIIAALVRLLGAHANAWTLETRAIGANLPARDEPFLCYQRRAPGDVTIAARGAKDNGLTHKIIGSAQRRRGAVLQHGSVLLGTSPAAPELPGLCDLTGVDVTMEALAAALPPETAALVGHSARPVTLPAEVEREATRLAREKYSSHRWTEHR